MIKKCRNSRLAVLIALLLSLLVTKHHYFFIFVFSFSVVTNNRNGISNSKRTHVVFSADTTMDAEESLLDDGDDNVYNTEDDHSLRFSGAGRLFSTDDSPEDIILERLQNSTVAVIGIGGVGSWTAEALCRSGVGNIILVDLDDVCISNSNRQLHAMSSTVGHMKTDVMKRRLLDINPNCNVTIIHDFVSTPYYNDVISIGIYGIILLFLL